MNWLVRLAAAFSPPEIDRMTLAVYAQKLSGEKPEHLEWATDRAIETCKHFPRISELLEMIRQKKIAEIDEQRILDHKRILDEPRNEAPPKLMELLKKERERGGPPRKLIS
jgi:hypothetical protein